MKSVAVLAAAFAGAAMAQDIPMPSGDCANLCINNMARIAESEFSCGNEDISCFCTRSNWAYGIRDCSREACDADQSAAAVSWAYARCAGVAATASDTPAALPILTSAVASVTGDAGSAASSAASSAAAAASSAASDANSAASSVASDASSAASSAASEVTSAASSVASDASSLTSSIISDANSAISSLQSEASGVLSSLSDALASATESAGSAASSAASAAESAASGASTAAEGAAPKATGISFAAGAGIAAWLLL